MNNKGKKTFSKKGVWFRKTLSGILILGVVFTGMPAPLTFAEDNNIFGNIQDQQIVDQKNNRPSYVEDEVLVKFKPKLKGFQISSVQAQMSLTKEESVPIIGADVMHIQDGKSVESVISALESSGMVEYAQPNYIYYPSVITPNDLHWTQLWGLNNTGQMLDGTSGTEGTPNIDIDAPEAWEYTSGLPEVTIAVIDTGVDISNSDLAGKIWTNSDEILNNNDDDGNGYVDDTNGWDFLNNNKTVYDSAIVDEHGTHVSGTIAAVANNTGVIGVAPNVKIMPLKFIGLSGGTTVDAIDAINYAAENGAQIINASWGSDFSSDDDALNAAIVDSGLLFVTAAGNGGADDIGDNNDVFPQSPANLPASNIISVAAVDNKGELADFSNYGLTTVDIAAPGVDILSTYPDNQYWFNSGTSMAAPHISGVAAVLMAQKNLTSQEAIEWIKSSGKPLASLAGKTVSGKMLNMYNAVATHVTQPNVSLGTSFSVAASSYSIAFNTGGYGKLSASKALKDTITIQFPAGTTLPGSITADKITVNSIPVGSAVQNIVPSGQEITFNVPIGIGHSGAVGVAISQLANIKNPSGGGAYELKVKTSADPVFQNSGSYNIISDSSVPTWAGNSAITASELSENSVVLNWNTASDDAGVVAYAVYSNGNFLTSVSSAVYSVTGLSPNTTYTFKVEAGDASGNWTTNGPSIILTTGGTSSGSGGGSGGEGDLPDITPPTWSSGNTLTASNITTNGLSLGWSAALDDVEVSGYRVYRGNTLTQTVAGNVYSYNVSGLSEGTNYTFKVEAGDAMGNWSADGPSTSVSTDKTVIDSGPGGGGGGGTSEELITPVATSITDESILTEKNPMTGNTIVGSTLTFSADENGKVQLTSDQVASMISKIENLAKQEKASQTENAGNVMSKIVISVTSTETTRASVSIPKKVVDSASANGIDGIEVTSPVASLNIPAQVIANVQADSIDVNVKVIADGDLTAEQKAAASGSIVFDFSIVATIGNTSTRINDFGADIEVSIPYTLKENENPNAITVYYLADSGQVENMQGSYDPKTKTIKFKTNHFSKYLIKANGVKFNDIDNYSWAKAQIESMAAKGIISGKKEGSYSPSDNITRAEFAALLVRAFRINDDAAASGTQFSDVKSDDWYASIVQKAVKAGLVTGYEDGTFRPDDNISRQDMAVMLARALKEYKGVSVPTDVNQYLKFGDQVSISEYARESIAVASKYGVVKGNRDNVFLPRNNLTRAEAAVVIYNSFFLE